MSTKRHSLGSKTSGFVPLHGGSTNNMTENEIPLATVRSNASTTGARRPNNANSFEDQDNSEKTTVNRRHAGRRRKLEAGDLKRRGTSDDVQVNAMGKIYNKIIGFSVVTRYLVYIVPVALLLAVPVIVLAVNNKTINVGKNKTGETVENGPTLYRLFLWIEITWLTLWATKVVAWFLPRVFMFFCGIVSMGVRKYATVLSNLTITLSLFFWALASWLTFKGVFRKSHDNSIEWVLIMERILGACFASSAVLLGEKALVQLIGVSYHQRSFANRIKASKREIHLLGLLYDASRTLFPMYCPEFADEDYVINDSIDLMLRRKAGYTNGSATPMRIIGDVGRIGDKVTSVFGNIASEITGKQVFNPHSAHSIVLEALEKSRSSEALARRIWMSFVIEGRDALYIDDFNEVLGPAYKADAEEAFNVIDADLNGDISLDEMIRKVVEMGKERKAIGEGMKDIGQALTVFDQVLLFVVLLIVVFIFLAFFNSSYITTVATAGTALLSLSFVFAVTTQEFLGSCIFLFVKHPYDVGDRVDINGSQLVVERISLLYTVFTRLDQMQIVQIPNIALNNLWIDNISRSKAMLECLEINVSYDTTFEDIELLRGEMERFVRHPDNSRDFQPDFTISVGSVGNLDKMTLQICIKHKSNWHNDGVRATRRSKFMCALALALKKIPIYGPGGGGEALGGPTNPSYSVAVTDEMAAKSRDDAAKAKDDARMIPSQTDKTEKEVLEAEKQAIAEINNRAVVESSPFDFRDDVTVHSRDLSEDPSRSKDIESIRTELMKRESQRGRRRAGESVPRMSGEVMSPGGVAQQGTPRLETFDEEARTDMPSSFYSLNRNEVSGGNQSYRLDDIPIEEDDEAGLRPMQSTSSRFGRGASPGSRRSPRGPSPRG